MARKQKPEEYNGYQAMAWIAWRTEKAVKAFSGPAPEAHAMWQLSERGIFPTGLGKPIVAPIAARHELMTAMKTGTVQWRKTPSTAS
jgi:hypothetical protein